MSGWEGFWQAPDRDVIAVVLGTAVGLISRILLLRSDYRQYPAYPHGRLIHLSLGLIAGALGALAVPALMAEEYTAITFLSLAAQQFREVRNMERNTLRAIDGQELVPRGDSYIEGIAVVFEGRNYVVMLAAFFVSLLSVWIGWWAGVAAGAAILPATRLLMRGRRVADIADISFAPVRMDGAGVYVGDIYMVNVGLEADRELIGRAGIGLVLVPKDDDARVTLAHAGQRQAILYDLSARLGVYRDEGEPALLPQAKLDLATGRVGVLALVRERDRDKVLTAVRNVPLLEAAVRHPARANRKRKEHGRWEKSSPS